MEHMFPIWPQTSVSLKREENVGESTTAEALSIPLMFSDSLFAFGSHISSVSQQTQTL